MKLLEIGPYPPPNSGWSVRIKFLKALFDKTGHDCKVLNLGKNRKSKNHQYMDVQNGFDYLKKLIFFRLSGYHSHAHLNAQAVKGPLLSLLALLASLLTFERAVITFHGGIDQLYFPKRNAGKMYWIIYLNFFLAGKIVCNNEQIKNEILNYGPLVNKEKIHPIPAFSVQYLDYEKTTLPAKLDQFIKRKKFIILCYIVLRNGFFIDTLIKFLQQLNTDIGVVLTGIKKVEDREVANFQHQLSKLEESGIVCLVDDLDHDQFMTLLRQSNIYLRTPISDGVASSVLEALSLEIPVVASENRRRPASVITYKANDAEDLLEKIGYVLQNEKDIKNKIIKPLIKDTVQDEINLISILFKSNKKSMD